MVSNLSKIVEMNDQKQSNPNEQKNRIDPSNNFKWARKSILVAPIKFLKVQKTKAIKRPNEENKQSKIQGSLI